MHVIYSTNYHTSHKREQLFCGGGTSVDGDGVVLGDLLDGVLLDEKSKTTASKGNLDAKALRDDSWGDELPGWNLLQQLLVGWLVEQRQVGELVTNLTLGPLLLIVNEAIEIINMRYDAEERRTAISKSNTLALLRLFKAHMQRFQTNLFLGLGTRGLGALGWGGSLLIILSLGLELAVREQQENRMGTNELHRGMK